MSHDGDNYGQWILFGDSITQQSFQAGGLGQRLSDTYQRRLDVVNRGETERRPFALTRRTELCQIGYGGYNTAWGLYVMYNVRVAIDEVCLGGTLNECTDHFGPVQAENECSLSMVGRQRRDTAQQDAIDLYRAVQGKSRHNDSHIP